MEPAVTRVPRQEWRYGHADATRRDGCRALPTEVAVALVYNGGTHAVMMATPADLQDFAVGFSLTEGIVASAGQVGLVDISNTDDGIELRMWLDDDSANALRERRRHLAGPTGCGLCGIESLAEANRPVPAVSAGLQFSPPDIQLALQALAPLQVLGRETRAVHAAAFWQPGAGIVAVREDVGRHNALDKLCGALARAGVDGASGVLLLTSRVSVELVQKAAAAGMTTLVAVSVPTALAVRTADRAGITTIAVARDDGFEVFTHPERIGHLGAAQETLQHHVA